MHLAGYVEIGHVDEGVDIAFGEALLDLFNHQFVRPLVEQGGLVVAVKGKRIL